VVTLTAVADSAVSHIMAACQAVSACSNITSLHRQTTIAVVAAVLLHLLQKTIIGTATGQDRELTNS
jgi:hypothetical protein